VSPSTDPSSANYDHARYVSAEIELVGEGGLAAFATRHRVRGDGPSYLYTRHRICSVPSCQPAIDSAAGTLATRSADSLFALAEGLNVFSLKDDYGITVGGADMITYSLRVNVGGRSKTIRADDGTMPEPMRKLTDAVRATIDAARR
jgi:hypothetical protein